MKTNPFLVTATMAVVLAAGVAEGMAAYPADKILATTLSAAKKEVERRPKQRSRPNRLHRQRLSPHSGRLPAANRLHLGWNPDRFLTLSYVLHREGGAAKV